MESLFLKLLNMSISAGWIIIAVALLRLPLKKAPRWLPCVLWALVAIRLVCPFSIESAMSLVPSAEPLPQTVITGNGFELSTGAEAIDGPVNEYLGDNYYEGVSVPADTGVKAMELLGWIWLLGAAAMLTYALFSYLRLRRRVGASICAGDNVWLCDDIKTPFILGIARPRIYIPSDMAEGRLPHVLAHERAHIKRRDHWWKPLGFLLLAAYWFNPLVWLAYVLLCRDIELACDEKVVRTMEKEGLIAYSEALLSCSVPRRQISACPLAFGEVGVKQRIKSVLSYKKPAFWIILAAAAACIAVALCFLTNPRSYGGVRALLNDTALPDAGKMEISSVSFVMDTGDYVDITDNIDVGQLKQCLTQLRCSAFTTRFAPYDVDGVSYEINGTYDGTVMHVLLGETSVLYESSDRGGYKIKNAFELTALIDQLLSGVETPFGFGYKVDEIIYDDLRFSFSYTLSTAPMYRLTAERELLALEAVSSVEWLNIGVFEETELTEENFDMLFETNNPEVQNIADNLRRLNMKAWSLKTPLNDTDTVLYYLLLQNNGDIYMTYGYTDERDDKTASSDQSLIRWVFKMAEADTNTMTVTSNGKSITPYACGLFSRTWGETDWVYESGAPVAERLPNIAAGLPELTLASDFQVREIPNVEILSCSVYSDSFEQLYGSVEPEFIKSLPVGTYYIGVAADINGDYISDGGGREHRSCEYVFKLMVTGELDLRTTDAAQPGEISYSAAYAHVGYTNYGYSSMMKYSENYDSDRRYGNVERLTPVKKIASVGELEDFYTRLAEYLDFTGSVDGYKAFSEQVQEYDEAFFKENTLFVAYVVGEAADTRYKLEEVRSENGILELRIRSVCQETDDKELDGWFVSVAVPNAAVAGHTGFDAYICATEYPGQRAVNGRLTRVYEYKGDDIAHTASVSLYDEGDFVFLFSPLSSYIATGKYTFDGDRLTLKTSDGKYTYTFNVFEYAIVLDGSASPTQTWYSGTGDGSVFELTYAAGEL